MEVYDEDQSIKFAGFVEVHNNDQSIKFNDFVEVYNNDQSIKFNDFVEVHNDDQSIVTELLCLYNNLIIEHKSANQKQV